jgi:ACS family glucarate transporter-like MFS transporter
MSITSVPGEKPRPTGGGRPTGVRHLVVALATLMAVLLYLDRNCLSIAEVYVKKDVGLSDAQVAWVFSAFSWTYAIAQVPSGWLGDRFGRRRVLTLYVVGWSAFTALMGLAQSFGALLACRLGCGLAQAGAYPTSAALLSRWAPFRERGRASGIVSTGGRLGGFLAPLLTAYLMVAFVPRADGDVDLRAWRPVLLVYGVAGLAVAALFWLAVRDRPADHPACNAAERALIEAGRPAGAVDRPVRGLPLGALLASPGLWFSSLSQFFTNFGWIFLLTWMPRYLDEVFGVGVIERGWMTSVPILLGMGGMLYGGWLTDGLTRRLGLRWGRCLPIALTRFVAMAAFLACPLAGSPWAATLILSAVAVGTDLGTPSTWAFLQDVGGRHVGSVLGWTNMWGNVGAALSPLVLAWLIGPARRWDLAFFACAAAFLAAGVVSLGIDARVPVERPE